MKTMKKVAMFAVCASAMTLAMQAQAKNNLVYTYDSNPLIWQSATLDDKPTTIFGYSVQPTVSFSFVAPMSWLSLTTPTTFTIPNVTLVKLSVGLPDNPYFMNPGSVGTVTVGAGGTILGWNMDFGGEVDKTDIMKLDAKFHFSTTTTSDLLASSNNIITDPHGGPYVVINRGEAIYGGPSNISGWQFASVSAVPEAPEYLMMAGGLGLFAWMARRRTKDQKLALPALMA
jgi:hypothetical protein